MFGFFKKKKQQNNHVIDPFIRETLIRTAQMIDMQLFICKSVEGYSYKMSTPYVRGYIFGFIDAALQYSKVDIGDDEKFFSLMLFGHMALLGKDGVADYLSTSVMMQNNIEFNKGQAEGGSEYFDYLSEKIKGPYKLSNHFHGI